MEPVISTKYGKVNGKIIEDLKGSKCYSFQGIPYAEPPVGDLRFRAPKPPKSWQGVLDCTQERSECLSKDFFQQNRVVGSEDCLFLNVYTSQLPQPGTPPLPVMVWIHGGGFNMGSSKTDIYGPEFLLTGKVLLVTINYRLGVFGFLSLEDPSLNVPGNNAFKDMVLALKWVKENIRNFNGDPNNVTIFGESAGGASVHFLILSPMAKGLFHKAILQSGCALNPWPPGVRLGKDLARILKLEVKNEKELLAALKELPAETILQAQNQLYDGLEAGIQRHMGFIVEKPCDEPAFLTELPLELIKSGRYNKVPMILGYTNKEGMITEFWYKMTPEGFQMPTDMETRIPYRFKVEKGSEKAKKISKMIKDFYFQGKEPAMDMIDSFYDLETDRYFLRGLYMSAKHHVTSSPTTPLYFYRFTIDHGLNLFKTVAQGKNPGAAHCDDVGYLFQTKLLPPPQKSSIEFQLVEKMVALWTNFAKSGDPSVGKAIWRPVTKERFVFMSIGDELVEGVDPEKERMKFWDEISAMTPFAKDM